LALDAYSAPVDAIRRSSSWCREGPAPGMRGHVGGIHLFAGDAFRAVACRVAVVEARRRLDSGEILADGAVTEAPAAYLLTSCSTARPREAPRTRARALL
jgi:hypothetical protein